MNHVWSQVLIDQLAIRIGFSMWEIDPKILGVVLEPKPPQGEIHGAALMLPSTPKALPPEDRDH
jgi:hypothetical protein